MRLQHIRGLSWRHLLALFLGVALLLAACAGSRDAAPATDSAEPAAESEQPAAESEAPAAESEEPADVAGGTLRVASLPIVQLDPAFISADSEVLIANAVYDYFVDVDAANQIQPRLARDWGVSDDGLTWTFKLVENAAWHDGDPFTAADVVYTFNRLRDPGLGSPTADLYANVTDITASGDYEVTFTLAESNPFFLFDLSDNHALVIKNGTTDATDFNGTGPFKLADYVPEDRVQLVANDSYFIDGQPSLDGVDIIFFNDETAAVDALRGGQVDLVMRMNTALFESLQGEDGIVTIDVPTNGFDLVRLRNDVPPGNDPRVVEAFKLATDRDAIFQLVAQGYGAVGRDSPIGPLYTSYYTEETAIPARNPDAARELLRQAGYEDGLNLVLHVPDSGNRPDLAQVLQAQWADAGINVELSIEPESVYYGDDGWLEVELGITGWGSRPYPQFYLDVMLTTGAQWNESRFSDAEFDELARIAGTTLDEAARVAAYSDIQRILIERGPVIIPYFFAQFGAISDNYDGFTMKAFPGRTDFRAVTYTP